MSSHISGVFRLQSPSGPAAYRIRPRAPNLTLPPEYSRLLHAKVQGSMGVHLVALQATGSSATLLSLSSASSPILQIISSTLNNTLELSFLNGEGGGRRPASFGFPGRNPFSREEWVQLAVSLEPERLAFYIDCQEAVILHVKHEENINLLIPQDVVVTLASTPGKKDSKFNVSFSPYFAETICLWIPVHVKRCKMHISLSVYNYRDIWRELKFQLTRISSGHGSVTISQVNTEHLHPFLLELTTEILHVRLRWDAWMTRRIVVVVVASQLIMYSVFSCHQVGRPESIS